MIIYKAAKHQVLRRAIPCCRCFSDRKGSENKPPICSDVNPTQEKTPPCPAKKLTDLEPCTVKCGQEQPKIVIIGAGMAGLSAAHRLAVCGLKNITIIESSDRPGGRIHSCWMGDVVAELGAQHIKGGCIANPVYTIAAQEGLIQNPLSRPEDDKGLFLTSEGRAIDHFVSLTAYHTYKRIEQQAASLFSLGCGSRGNLLSFIGMRLQQELFSFPEEQRCDAARVMYGLANILRSKCGSDLSLISADQFGSYIDIPGGDVRIPLGFIGVLSPLLRDIPEGAICYSKTVESILWGTVTSCEGARAVVKCCDGSEYTADYVVVTLPLGVLKAKASTMFCPALPCNKKDAIDCLGYGTVNKVFLEYNRPFWVWKDGSFKLAWSAEELSTRENWVKGLCYLEEVPGSQNVLCGWIAGSEAVDMESFCDEEVAVCITKTLRQFTGDSSLPYPSSILRTRWSTDCNFCGAYSYLAVNSGVSHQCELGSPLPGTCGPIAPILLFAGEATIPGHYATVHGARISGIREAERIIQLTEKYGGPPLPPEKVYCKREDPPPPKCS